MGFIDRYVECTFIRPDQGRLRKMQPKALAGRNRTRGPAIPMQRSNQLGSVVQRWVGTNPGLKFNLLF